MKLNEDVFVFYVSQWLCSWEEKFFVPSLGYHDSYLFLLWIFWIALVIMPCGNELYLAIYWETMSKASLSETETHDIGTVNKVGHFIKINFHIVFVSVKMK